MGNQATSEGVKNLENRRIFVDLSDLFEPGQKIQKVVNLDRKMCEMHSTIGCLTEHLVESVNIFLSRFQILAYNGESYMDEECSLDILRDGDNLRIIRLKTALEEGLLVPRHLVPFLL